MSGDTVKKLVRRVKFVDYGKFGLSGYSLRVRERSATGLFIFIANATFHIVTFLF
ncbi:hypothetical protein M8C10_09225 [Bacillus spizizenii]